MDICEARGREELDPPWWLFASSFVLFYIAIFSQLVASKIEESYCSVLLRQKIAAYGDD